MLPLRPSNPKEYEGSGYTAKILRLIFGVNMRGIALSTRADESNKMQMRVL